jgi:hypothetical protein
MVYPTLVLDLLRRSGYSDGNGDWTMGWDCHRQMGRYVLHS